MSSLLNYVVVYQRRSNAHLSANEHPFVCLGKLSPTLPVKCDARTKEVGHGSIISNLHEYIEIKIEPEAKSMLYTQKRPLKKHNISILCFESAHPSKNKDAH